MAEPLFFDIEFNAAQSAAEAEQSLQGIQDSADALGRSISDAFDSAQQVVATLASASVGDLEQLSLFGDAAQNADQLAAGLTTAADAGQTAAQAASDVAAGMGEAGAAAGELAAGADAVAAAAETTAGAQDKVRDSTDKTTESQKKSTEETAKGVDLAGRLSAEFEKVAGKAGGLVGPMSQFADEAVKAVGALEGASGLAAGGFAAGAVGLLAAGSSFKQASDTITLATGATGQALQGLQGDFATALQGSGRSASDLAQIFGTLTRDTGVAGDALAKATDQTAKFLKVTNGSVGDVRGLTQAMLALGVGAGGLSGFEDQLATVTTHFGISLGSLVQQIKVAGPALATFGFDPGQVAGLIGELDQAGLSIQRLVPGFTKLAQTATADGKTAAVALTDLITRIKGAGDSQAALNEVRGVFSGRVAAQFVNAVRNGTVDIGKLNAVMAESPGTVNRLGESVKGLAAQFGGIRNEILATFGQAGLPFLESLRGAIEDIRPTLRSLLEALGALTPAFKGFGEVLLLPIEALRLLDEPLHLLADVLHLVPAPILEVAGAFAALQLIGFAGIAEGIGAVVSSMFAAATAGPALFAVSDAAGALVGGVTAALSSINPVTLAAAGGIALVTGVMRARAADAADFQHKVEGLEKALGDVAVTSDAAAPKLNELFQGDKGAGGLGDDIKKTLADAGVSIAEFTQLTQQAAADPSLDIGRALRQHILEDVGGIQNLVDKFHGVSTGSREAAAEQLKTADGAKRLADEWVRQGTVAGEVDKNLAALERAQLKTNDAVQAAAKGQIQDLVLKGQVKQADIDAAVSSLGLKKEKDNEAAVYGVLAKQVNEARLSKLGLATADAGENEKRGAILDDLEKEGGLHDQVAGATGAHAAALNALIDATKSGVPTDQQRIDIIEKTGVGAKELTKAEQELADLQAKHTPVTQAFNDALRNTFEQIGHGTGEFQAITGAAQAFGVDAVALGGAFDNLNAQLQKFAPPVKAGDDVMGQLLFDMQQGLPIQSTFKDLLEVSGGNAEVAFAALTDYKKGVDDTKKALDGLAPSLGTVVSKLQDQSKIEGLTGPDASGQAQAIQATSDARKADLQSQIDDLNAAKQARSDADQASIDARKAALQNQKQVASDAAKARGEAFDSTGIDLQIKALKARTDTSDLDAQIKVLEGDQKDLDAALARAQAALQPFQDEEKAIRANAALRDSDLAQQQAQLAQARDLAQQQADAQGKAFDQTPINNRINDLQAQRDQIASLTAGAIASAEGTSARVQADVEKAQGGILDFQSVLDTFDAQNVQKAQEAATVAQLRADGMTATIQTLFDPNNGLSEADQQAFLNQLATASPEERAAIEAHAAASLQLVQQKNDAISKASDIFAQPNPEFVTHATARGDELAKGLADGFVKGLTDSKINDIIDLVIKTGVDPVAARKAVTDKFAAAQAAAQPGAEGLAGVGISVDQVQGIEQALGLAGTTSGALFVQAAQDAIKNTTIDPDAAAAMLQPVQDQLPIEGAAGGASVASTVGETIKNSPIDADAASVLVANVQTQLPLEGSAGGAGYSGGVAAGMALYPVPTEAGTILVASVGQALTVAGTDAGANYALSVAAGIAAKQGDAVAAAHLAAIRVDEAGHAGLEAASPSKKGLRLGGFWIDGIVAGITGGLPQLTAAAKAVGDAVAAPLPAPALVGAGVAPGAAGGAAAAAGGTGAGTSVHIENVNVAGTMNASADDVATAFSRKIGWLGITGRAEL